MSGNQEFLASVPLFQSLSKKDLDRLNTVARERTFPAGSEIVKEGEAGVGFFIIMSGRAVVRHGGQSGAEIKAGQYFGEIALLDDQRRTASIYAAEDTRCLMLTRWDFLAEVRSDPELAIELLKVLIRRIRDLEAQSSPTTQ